MGRLRSRFAVWTVQVVTPAVTDDRGTIKPNWALPPVSEVDVPGCVVQPLESSEDTTNRQSTLYRVRVWLPAGVAVTASDGIRWKGRLFMVDAPPLDWDNPAGRLSHIHLTATEHRG